MQKTEIHLACQDGDKLAEVKRLCSSGIDINAQDEDGRTALHLAVLGRAIHVATWLLTNHFELRLDLHIKDSRGYTAADYLRVIKHTADMITVDVRGEHVHDYDFMIATCSFSENMGSQFRTAFTHAATYLDTATDLRNHFAAHKLADNLIAIKRRFNMPAGKRLVQLAKDGNFAAIADVPHWRAIINFQNDTGHTALYYSFLQQNWQQAQWLLENGASLAMCYAKNKHPLQVLIAIEYLPDAAVQLFKEIINKHYWTLNDVYSKHIEGLIIALVSRHILDARFVPDAKDSYEYFRFYDSMREKQLHYSAFDLNMLSEPLKTRFGSLSLLKHNLLMAHAMVHQYHAAELYNMLPDVTPEQLNEIGELITAIIPWREVSAGLIKTDAAVQCFEIIHRSYNDLQMAFGIITADKFIYGIAVNANVKVHYYDISDRQKLVLALNTTCGKILERTAWPHLLRGLLTPLRVISFANSSKYGLIYQTIAHLVLNEVKAVTQLSHIVIAYNHVHQADQLAKAEATLVNFENTYQNPQLIPLSMLMRVDVATALQTALRKVSKLRKTISSETVNLTFSHYFQMRPSLKISLPYPLHDYPAMDLLSVLGQTSYVVMHEGAFGKTERLAWFDAIPDSACKLAALAVGIAPNIAVQSWLRPKHLAALYLGVKPELVTELSDAKLNAFKDGVDLDKDGVDLDKAMERNRIIRMGSIRDHLRVINQASQQVCAVLGTLGTAPNIIASMTELYSLEQSDGLPLDFLTLFTYSYIATYQQTSYLTFKDIQAADLSFEKLAVLAGRKILFADIANEAAVMSAAKSYGYSGAAMRDWRDLVCYIRQITRDELTYYMYNESPAMVAELNNIQRLGLLFGFVLDVVTAAEFNEDVLAKHLFYGSQLDPQEQTAFIKFKQDNNKLFSATAPFKRNVIVAVPDMFSPRIATQQDVIVEAIPEIQDLAQTLTKHNKNLYLTDQALLIECKSGNWANVAYMLQNGADILKSFPNGASPLESIAFNENQSPEYCELMRTIANVIHAANNYQLSFYSSLGFYYPFMGALAAAQVLGAELLPHRDDNAAYKYFYKIIRTMQVKSMLHYHLELPTWYDSVEGIGNKPTGSFGRVMQNEYLYYHRRLFTDDREISSHFERKIKKATNLPARCKVSVDQESSKISRTDFIDHVMQNYTATSRANWNNLVSKVKNNLPVAFEIEIMLDFYAHNLNGYMSGTILYIADRSRGDAAITIYKILDKDQLLAELPYIFGSRVEQVFLKQFESSTCLEKLYEFALPKQTAFNCTFASMEALYCAIVLDTFLADLSIAPDGIIKQVVTDWSNSVRNYGVYIAVHELQAIAPPKTDAISLFDLLIRFETVELLYERRVFCFENLTRYLRNKFIWNAVTNAKCAGIDLNAMKLIYDALDNTTANFLYDLGPRAAHYVAECNSKQLIGLNYGLTEQQVKAPDYDVAKARLLLFYPQERLAKLSQHQVHAMRGDLAIEVAESSWFRAHHAYAVTQMGIKDPDQLELLNLVHVTAVELDLFSPEDIINCTHMSVLHIAALHLEPEALRSSEILSLPGPFALGLSCGLTKEQILNPKFNGYVAGAVAKGLSFEQACSLINVEHVFVSEHDLSFSTLEHSELSHEKQLFLLCCDAVKFQDIATDNAARCYALRHQCPSNMLKRHDFAWIHAVAFVAGVKEELLDDMSMDELLRHTIATLHPEQSNPSFAALNLRNFVMRIVNSEYFASDDATNYSAEQLDCIKLGLTAAEVQQPWFATEHFVAAKLWGMNIRTLVGLDAAAVNAALDQYRAAGVTQQCFVNFDRSVSPDRVTKPSMRAE